MTIVNLLMFLLSINSLRFARAMHTMRAVVFDSAGSADVLRVSHEAAAPAAAAAADSNAVEISVAYSAVNRADILQRMGKYPVPAGESPILGLEASGIVRAVGSRVSHVKVGDRVMALMGGGGYAEIATVAADHVMQVPRGMSLREAAALPEAWLTAYQLLYFVGDLAEGERVLVHAAASGVGTAAVQLAASISNATVFATAGSQPKCDLALSVGAKHCCNYKLHDFAQVVSAATRNQGVHVILDCVGTTHLASNLNCLANDARWVLYGLLGGGSLQGENFLAKLLSKRASLRSTLLRNRSHEYKASLVSEFAQKALPLFGSGQLRAVIDSEFPLDQVAEAHRRMEANLNLGKILLNVNSDLEQHRPNGEL